MHFYNELKRGLIKLMESNIKIIVNVNVNLNTKYNLNTSIEPNRDCPKNFEGLNFL